MTGAQLKKLLSARGIKQTELAEKLGVTKQTVNAGLSVADVKTGLLEKICKAFDVDMNYFFPEFCVSGESYMVRINFYEALCELREKRIKELEEEVAQLKMEKTKIG